MKINRKQRRLSMLFAGISVLGLLFVTVFRYNTPSARALSDASAGAALSDAGTEQNHYITIFDGQKKLVVKSSASTVRDVLARADIHIGANDIVEPGLDETIDGQDFYINIYRAREIVVLDGSVRKYIKTAAVEGSEVADAAGLKLQEADLVELVPYNGLLESGMTSAYQVIRAKAVNVNFYGQNITKRTQAKTIGEFLKEQNIERDEQKVWVSLMDDALIYDGLNLTIAHQGKQTVTLEEAIAFDEKLTYDYNLPHGKREIVTPGQPGKKAVTYEIEMRNGQELGRVAISEIVTVPAKTQETVVGMKVSLPSGSHQDWMAAAGISADDYGYVNYIISHESSWRPNASNGQYHGLYQTNLGRLTADCGSDWVNDAVCQLRSANKYATGRYGSWEAAYQHWTTKHWW